MSVYESMTHFQPQAVTADSGSEDEVMERKRALEEVCDPAVMEYISHLCRR